MQTRRRVIAGGAVAALAGATWGGRAAAEGEAALDAYLEPFVRSRDFAGVILFARGDTVTACRAYGLADVERAIPNGRSSRFNIGSVAKLLTLTTLKRQQAAGVLSLTDPLSRWLPDFPHGDLITLKMLLLHRSGLPRDFAGFEAFQTRPHTTQELVEAISREPLLFAPDSASAYSNSGYRVLARVIERASGLGYHEAVARLVLEPNGMADTGPDFGAPVRNLAKGYRVGAAPRSLSEPLAADFSNYVGASSFYSTVDDLHKLTGLLTAPAPDSDPKERSRNGHDGLALGYSSLCYRYAAGDHRLIMLSNIESGLFDALHGDLETLMFGGRPTPPVEPVFGAWPAAAVLARYVGVYEIAPGARMTVKRSAAGLAIDAGDGFVELSPINERTCFLRLKFAELEFVEAAGKVSAMEWRQGGQTFHCPKVA